MKKRIQSVLLVLIFVLANVHPAAVQAMLTEEEQEYYRQKREEAAGQPAGTSVQTDEDEGSDETSADVKERSSEPVEEAGTEKSSETSAETDAKEQASETSEETDAAGAEPEAETETDAETEAPSGDITAGEISGGNPDAPLIAIDPGHQGPGFDMSGVEPNGPGSSVMKARLATGTAGIVSGLAEYELVLQVSLKLRDELVRRGYRVIMTRETHDIDISNIERCQVANESGADILLRIHANGSEDSSVAGALTTAPSAGNPYLMNIYNSCVKLADDMINAYCEETGLQNRGLWITDDMTGMNWSEVPVTILEMGFMTNPGDDAYMADPSNQDIMVRGIANGVDRYFGGPPAPAEEPESETATEAVTEAESETVAETETESETVTEAATEPESETETESETATETEAESEIVTEAVTEAESETVAEALMELKSEAASEEESETATEAVTEPESETETESEPTTETETESEAVTEAATEAESETGPEIMGDPGAPLVALDPGHQAANAAVPREIAVGPGAAEMKDGITPGTVGVVSGLNEYELNLSICLKLRDELLDRGYRVLLTRETNDVDLDDAQRAQLANEAQADILLRIHANASSDETLNGASTMAPSSTNPYLADVYNSCVKLADDMINEYCETTGLKNRGLWISDNMTGLNWSEMPVTMLEMGCMSNAEDDTYMAKEDNQDKMVQGIANGVDRFFGR